MTNERETWHIHIEMNPGDGSSAPFEDATICMCADGKSCDDWHDAQFIEVYTEDYSEKRAILDQIIADHNRSLGHGSEQEPEPMDGYRPPESTTSNIHHHRVVSGLGETWSAHWHLGGSVPHAHEPGLGTDWRQLYEQAQALCNEQEGLILKRGEELALLNTRLVAMTSAYEQARGALEAIIDGERMTSMEWRQKYPQFIKASDEYRAQTFTARDTFGKAIALAALNLEAENGQA